MDHFRYVKAHFNSPVKLMKTITNGPNLITDETIGQETINEVEGILQDLTPPVEGASGNDDVLCIHEYVIAFLNYYYAHNKLELPKPRHSRSASGSKGLLESLSRKSKTKSKVSKQDVIQPVDKDDPIDDMKLPQEGKAGSKHLRTKSHAKDAAPPTIEVEAEQRLGKIRSTSRDKQFDRRIEEVENDSDSKHTTPKGPIETKVKETLQNLKDKSEEEVRIVTSESLKQAHSNDNVKPFTVKEQNYLPVEILHSIEEVIEVKKEDAPKTFNSIPDDAVIKEEDDEDASRRDESEVSKPNYSDAESKEPSKIIVENIEVPVPRERSLPRSQEEPRKRETSQPKVEKRDASAPKKEEAKRDTSIPKKEEPKRDISAPRKEVPTGNDFNAKKDDVKRDASVPKKEEPKRDVSAPKKEEPKRDVSAPKKEEPKRDVSAPKKEETKKEVSAPKKEEPKRDVSAPKKEEPKRDVSAPKKPLDSKVTPQPKKDDPVANSEAKKQPEREISQPKKMTEPAKGTLEPKKNSSTPKQSAEQPKKESLAPKGNNSTNQRTLITASPIQETAREESEAVTTRREDSLTSESRIIQDTSLSTLGKRETSTSKKVVPKNREDSLPSSKKPIDKTPQSAPSKKTVEAIKPSLASPTPVIKKEPIEEQQKKETTKPSPPPSVKGAKKTEAELKKEIQAKILANKQASKAGAVASKSKDKTQSAVSASVNKEPVKEQAKVLKESDQVKSKDKLTPNLKSTEKSTDKGKPTNKSLEKDKSKLEIVRENTTTSKQGKSEIDSSTKASESKKTRETSKSKVSDAKPYVENSSKAKADGKQKSQTGSTISQPSKSAAAGPISKTTTQPSGKADSKHSSSGLTGNSSTLKNGSKVTSTSADKRKEGNLSKLSVVESENLSESTSKAKVTKKAGAATPSNEGGNWKKKTTQAVEVDAKSSATNPRSISKNKPSDKKDGPKHSGLSKTSVEKSGAKVEVSKKVETKAAESRPKTALEKARDERKAQTSSKDLRASSSQAKSKASKSPNRGSQEALFKSRPYKKQPAKTSIVSRTNLDGTNYSSERSISQPTQSDMSHQEEPPQAPEVKRNLGKKISLPSLDIALALFKDKRKYVSPQKILSNRSNLKPAVDRIEQNKKGFGLRSVLQEHRSFDERHKPTFDQTSFIYKWQKSARTKTLQDEKSKLGRTPRGNISEAGDEPKTNRSHSHSTVKKIDKRPLDDIFKKFSKKNLRDLGRVHSAKTLPNHINKYSNKTDKLMSYQPKTKIEATSIVKKFQDDVELLRNHLEKKADAVNPTLKEIEKEKTAFSELKLKQSSLLFEIERSHKRHELEQKKKEEHELEEFQRQKRKEGIEYDKNIRNSKREELKKERKEAVEEGKRIKQEVKEIMSKNYEDEKNFYEKSLNKPGKKDPQASMMEQKHKKTSPLEFRALIEEAAYGHNYPYMRTYHQERDNELKAEKNQYRGQIASMIEEVRFLENIHKMQKEIEQSGPKAPVKK